jgi:transcription elongation factor GreA
MGDTYLTKQGFEKLKAEEQSLVQQKIRLTEEVSKAAAMGDLRENAEYHAARERLQHVSQRLAELHTKLTTVCLIDDLHIKDGEARVGTVVTLKDEEAKDTFQYRLVGPDEADPPQGKLSIESPLGKSLLGKKKGERVTLTLPRATVVYQVVNVERSKE